MRIERQAIQEIVGMEMYFAVLTPSGYPLCMHKHVLEVRFRYPERDVTTDVHWEEVGRWYALMEDGNEIPVEELFMDKESALRFLHKQTIKDGYIDVVRTNVTMCVFGSPLDELMANPEPEKEEYAVQGDGYEEE